MNSSDVVYNRFIAPLNKKTFGNVGVELEFPLINLDKKPVDKAFALGFLYSLLEQGFTVQEYDNSGNPAFVENSDGDVISFDNSYNNIEFSMNYGKNLIHIKDRFYNLHNTATEYFSKLNYIIAGLGINPYKQYTEVSHVDYPVYNMVENFLHRFNCEYTHDYPDFPAYLSSVQTHLDADVNDVPIIADFFAKIDFALAYILSNSPSFDDTNYLCMRDFLWHKSAFGLLKGHTGVPDESFTNIDGLEESILNRFMFNRIRSDKYELINPIKLCDYFDMDDSKPKDIEQYLSFRNVEVTARGTIEVRSSCTQPLCNAFAPPALYLGLANNIKSAIGITDDFFQQYNLKYKNSELREMAVSGVIPKEIDKDGLIRFIMSLLDASSTGLKNRGLGEEELIQCLYKRAKDLSCPALIMKTRIANGESLENIIMEYSKI